MTTKPVGNSRLTYGISSVGRALVSKTRCREFEPLIPCKEEKEMKVFKKLFADMQESYDELVYKVSWPTRVQLVNSAMIVLVASIILSLVIWGVDQAINFIMEHIYAL